ncbi:MAG: peptidoglycan-binding protein [Acidimicrobiales bacterium]
MPVLSQNPQRDPRPNGNAPEVAGKATAIVTPGADNGRRSWPWRWIIGAAALAGVAAVGLAVLSSTGNDAETVDPGDATLETVEATQADLVEYTDLAGTLQYASNRNVTATATGTVTDVPAEGTVLSRGDTVYAVDADPVVVVYGNVPLYRQLTSGDEGTDVRLVEENLASLGFHTYQDDDDLDVNTGFVVDGVFDSATEDAVLRFQEHYGLQETGSLDPATFVVLNGPATVSDVDTDLGATVQPGTSILNLNLNSTVIAFYAAHSGDLELESTSSAVTNGSVIYIVDDIPVSAVMVEPDIDLVLTRNLYLGIADGPDVAAVEQMLADLGYDADGEMTVDEEFTSATTEAINDWEDDLEDQWDDVVNDGVVSISEIVLVEAGTDLTTPSPLDSDLTASGTELASTTIDQGSRMVLTAIPVADQDAMAEGQEVDIEFPDGTIVVGTVTDIAGSTTVEAGDPEAEPLLAVEIGLGDIPESVEGLVEVDVTVKLVDRMATGVTVVPASALVATADGGFAVEVATGGGATQFVAVDPGQFTDGLVEVDGIDPGTAVVVPR